MAELSYIRILIFLVSMMLNFQGIPGQNQVKVRLPSVAGQFYPGSAPELMNKLKTLYRSVEVSDNPDRIRAILVPHAGYDFSGRIAAEGYKQLADLSDFDNIFILASSHHLSLGKVSVYTAGNYKTPLGEVAVNTEIGKELTKNSLIGHEPSAHKDEHSIEVQLPFLQYFDKLPPIVPIVIASQVPTVSRELASALKPWFNENNLFIVSADFSHYPSWSDAKIVDSRTAQGFCSGSSEEFLAVLEQNDQARIKGLSTSMCAWPAALTLLYLSQEDPHLYYQTIRYANSGDVKPYGDKRRVVGYYSIALRDSKKPKEFFLSPKDKHDLLELARQTLNVHVYGTGQVSTDHLNLTKNLEEQAGAFVSLKIDGQLRGCIGNFTPDKSLTDLIPELTIASASRDSRFLPVRSDEVKDISIEISVLTPLKKIDTIEELTLGKHGIYMIKGGKSGTFLPQVATEAGWDLEEFLGRCARDKAGIGYEGWKTADLYIYEAFVFTEF